MVYRIRKVFQSGCFLGFLIGAQVCAGQISDNFLDGNFSDNPLWVGSSSDFIVNATSQLQLSNTVASTSQLSTVFTSASLNNFEWQFYLKQTFAPSASNYGRVYLASDQSNLNSPLNGYYLQFGEALSSDAVELFRQTGSASVSVCRATNGAISAGSNLRVRVLRSSAGLWQLFIDYAGGTNFVLETSGTDAIHNSSGFFGILCVYTSSNANKFFFDDFYAGPEILDTTPPSLQSVTPTSANQLTVIFNEKVDPVTSQLTANYSVNNNVGSPLTATLQLDQKTIHLSFALPFSNGITSQITVSGIKDLFNNGMTSVNMDFLFFQPATSAWKDIIITEIFSDPSPSVGLPEAEFIEIFNRSEKIFDLQNWIITDGSSVGVMPSHLIFPQQYVILTAAGSTSLFNSFGSAIAISNFPTLNNSGDALTLKDDNSAFVDVVNYMDSWYRDDDKKQGGFTLELVDPANICAEEENWIASESSSGGTPGIQNAVFENKPDVTAPKVVSAIPISSIAVVVTFNEKLEDKIPTVSSFVINPPVSIASISFTDGSLKSMQLLLDVSLQSATTYTLQTQAIYDCNGNSIQPEFSSIEFGLPENASQSDIVINEILFNPRPTGVDFVEIYNSSSKYVNLKDWKFSNYEEGLITNAKVITSEDFLLAPNQYVVFTEDKNIIRGEYILSNEENTFEVPNLPSLNDDEGTVALLDFENEIIDFLFYKDDYHSLFINDDEGVSLERISFAESSNNKSNWKSASSLVGFATPGYVNSNISNEKSLGKITVSPEVFEPVNGQPSFTQIHYNFSQGGFVANVKILDTQGREIKYLENNAMLGTKGFFRWDGDTNDGSKARVGYYIVWVEVFNGKGEIETFRKRVVVASKKRP